jgi:hypothetical protein
VELKIFVGFLRFSSKLVGLGGKLTRAKKINKSLPLKRNTIAQKSAHSKLLTKKDAKKTFFPVPLTGVEI